MKDQMRIPIGDEEERRRRERIEEEARLFRENREGYYESLSRNVGRYETMRDAAISAGVSYAQIGLRSAFLLNGGAIGLVLPALATAGLLTIESLQWPALSFIVGIAFAAACSILAFLNFEQISASRQNQANESQKVIYRSYFPDPNVSHQQFEEELREFRRERTAIDKTIWWMYYLALGTGILSFVSFWVGSLLLIFGADAPTGQPSVHLYPPL